jgi:hypothetical protein
VDGGAPFAEYELKTKHKDLEAQRPADYKAGERIPPLTTESQSLVDEKLQYIYHSRSQSNINHQYLSPVDPQARHGVENGTTADAHGITSHSKSPQETDLRPQTILQHTLITERFHSSGK